MVELGLGGGRGHVEVMFLLSVAVVVSPVRVRGFHVFHGLCRVRTISACQDNFGHGEVTLVSSVAVFVSCVRGHVFHVLSLVVRRVGSSRSAWTRACVEARGGDASVMCGGYHVTCACWCFLPLLSGLVWAKWDLFSVRVKSS